MAEGEGFEPPEPLPVQRFSRPPHSTTLPSFQSVDFIFDSEATDKFQNSIDHFRLFFS